MAVITHRVAYTRPTSVSTAVDLLARYPDEARVLAGGQSLIPLMKLEFAQPGLLVDISGIDELERVGAGSDGTIEIGAMVRHERIRTDPRIAELLPLLGAVAGAVGDPQIRTLGTIGGVIAHADPAGDYCMLALLLDAVVLTDRREVAAREFFLGPFTTVLQPGELVTAVRFPVTRDGHAYVKIVEMPFDSGIPGVAVQHLAGGWRIGLTNVGHERSRATTVESALEEGATPEEAVAQAWSDLPGDSGQPVPVGYRIHLARALTVRALERARTGVAS